MRHEPTVGLADRVALRWLAEREVGARRAGGADGVRPIDIARAHDRDRPRPSRAQAVAGQRLLASRPPTARHDGLDRLLDGGGKRSELADVAPPRRKRVRTGIAAGHASPAAARPERRPDVPFPVSKVTLSCVQTAA